MVDLQLIHIDVLLLKTISQQVQIYILYII